MKHPIKIKKTRNKTRKNKSRTRTRNKNRNTRIKGGAFGFGQGGAGEAFGFGQGGGANGQGGAQLTPFSMNKVFNDEAKRDPDIVLTLEERGLLYRINFSPIQSIHDIEEEFQRTPNEPWMLGPSRIVTEKDINKWLTHEYVKSGGVDVYTTRKLMLDIQTFPERWWPRYVDYVVSCIIDQSRINSTRPIIGYDDEMQSFFRKTNNGKELLIKLYQYHPLRLDPPLTRKILRQMLDEIISCMKKCAIEIEAQIQAGPRPMKYMNN